MKKEITVLTKSKKHGGFCVAGIDTNGNWVRVVKPHGGEVHRQDLLYENNGEAQVFDLLEIELQGRDDIFFQPENYIMLDGKRLKKTGVSNIIMLETRYRLDSEKRDYIYFDYHPSIAAETIRTFNREELYSLMVVKVRNPMIRVTVFDNGESKTIINFLYKGLWHNGFRITDLEFLHDYDIQNNSFEKLIGEFYLVISLGEEFIGHHYKLVSSIIKC